MPPFAEYSLVLLSACTSFFMRLMGLNWSDREGFSEGGEGFCPPKKLEVGALRGSGRGGTASFLGLDALLLFPPGVKVLAAGLGRNSSALTLNLVEMLDEGV